MEINKLISEKTLNSDKKKVTIERMEKIEKVIKQLPISSNEQSFIQISKLICFNLTNKGLEELLLELKKINIFKNLNL